MLSSFFFQRKFSKLVFRPFILVNIVFLLINFSAFSAQNDGTKKFTFKRVVNKAIENSTEVKSIGELIEENHLTKTKTYILKTAAVDDKSWILKQDFDIKKYQLDAEFNEDAYLAWKRTNIGDGTKELAKLYFVKYPDKNDEEEIDPQNQVVINDVQIRQENLEETKPQEIQIAQPIKEPEKPIIKKPQEPQKYLARTDLVYANSSLRSFKQVDLFLPVWQSKNQLMFADVRYFADSKSNNEGNLGLGYRKLYDNFIWGGYGFYDRRVSTYNNMFKQLTFGSEILTKDYDLRANFYLPIGNTAKSADGAAVGTSQISNMHLSGHNVVYDVQSFYAEEYALQGYDLEIGKKMPIFKDLRAFIAYYNFYKSNIDVKGYRARALYNLYDGEKNKFFLEGAYYNDNTKDTTYLGFRYRYSFGDVNKVKLNDLEKRMTNQVVRDVDIITQTQTNTRTTTQDLKAQDGSVEQIYFVNGNAASGGDGTYEKPYQTLSSAISSSSTGDTIYAYGGNYNENITLKNNQKLLGHGDNLTASDITGNSSDTSILINSGSYAAISSTSGPVITTATNNTISGMDISGAGQVGILHNNSSTGVTIENNYIHNTATGVSIAASSNNLNNTIRDNTITGNSGSGVLINASNSTSVTNNISSNNISSNGNRGIEIVASNSATVTNNITGNSNINSNIQDGIYIVTNNSSTATNTISGNGLSGNNNGIYINSNDSSSDNFTISSNTINSNSGKGVYVTSNNLSTLNATVSSNTISSNGGDGINMAANGTSVDTTQLLTISNNTINSNNYGINYSTTNAGSLIASVDSNTLNGNNSSGILVTSSSSSSLSSTILNNNLKNNLGSAIEASSNNSSSLTNNINNNSFSGNSNDSVRMTSNQTSNLNSSLSGNTTTDTNAVRAISYNTSRLSLNGLSNNFGSGALVITRDTSDAPGSVLTANFTASSSYGSNKILGTVTLTNVNISAQYNYWGGGNIASGKLTLNGSSSLNSSNYRLIDPFN